MSIISGLVRRPVSMLIGVLLISVFSLFTASRISLDFLPDVEFPRVTIFTNYDGANPVEVEDTITKPLESAIRGIPNLSKITSRSRNGASIISVEFKYGTGLDQNVSTLQERVDRVKASLPAEASAPVVFRFSSSDVPVISLAITSNRNINDARQYIEDNMLSYFEQIDGIANVQLQGGDVKKVFVETSINRLNAFGLTLSSIANSIRNNGQRSSLGYIETDVSDVAMVVDNKFDNINDLRNLVIADRIGEGGEEYFIKLNDVADVRIGYDDSGADASLFDGKPAVTMDLYKLSGANIVDVANEVRRTIAKVEAISPQDFSFTIFDDNSVFIKNSIRAVGSAAAGGGVLAILVLLLFLRNIRSVLIIAISMPISILLTMMFMYFAGLTLNFMSLAGLTLGIGMLVDNAVVILEHIYNKRLSGQKLVPASEYGAREMARPVLASTLTTVLVFAPLLLFKNELGVTGGFFSALSFTVVVSVISSYCVAVFVVPILTSKYIKLYRAKHRGIGKFFDTLLEKFLTDMSHNYQKSLRYIILKPWRSFFLILFLVILSFVYFAVKMPGFSFAPSFTPEAVNMTFSFPTTMKKNEKFQYVQDFAERTSYIFGKHGAERGDVQITVSGRNAGRNDIFGGSSNSATYTIFYKEEITQAMHKRIIAEYETYKNIYPGIRIRIRPDGRGRRSTGAASGLSLELKSNDYDKLQETASLYKSMIIKDFQGKITNVDDDQPDSSLEYDLAIDRALANSYGISVSGLISEIKTAISGSKTNKYREGASEYDIVLRLNEEDRAKTDLAEQLFFDTNKGTRIPIVNLIDKSYASGTGEIRRSDFQRTIVISGKLLGDYTTTQAVSDVRKKLQAIPKDDAVTYFFTGEFESLNENFKILGIVFILAALFIYGIMASQFESFLDPFIIMMTVPLTFSGVGIIYALTQNAITSFTIVGVVMLVGIAVNHGIVLVDYMNLLRKRGHSLKNAIILGGASRLQPILMTTSTTVLGLLPIVILEISGAELIKPLALTVVGGLTSSALLSLFFVPLVYYKLNKIKLKLKRKTSRRQREREEYTISASKEMKDDFNVLFDE